MTSVDLFGEWEHQKNVYQMKVEEEDCSICREKMNEYDMECPIYVLPQCKHVFHVQCLMDWFRMSGNSWCPYCHQDLDQKLKVSGHGSYGRRGKFGLLLDYGKRRDANPEVKRIVEKYQKMEKRMKESRQKITDFEKDHKEMLQQYEKLKGEWRNDRRKLFIMEGMMRAIPVVPIVIYKKDKK